MTPLIYRSPLVYNLIMRLLYGSHARMRCATIAALIPDGASVLDVCCGTCGLYSCLKSRRSIRYTGIDCSAPFVAAGQRFGLDVREMNVAADVLPSGYDWVVMQASLYQFHPDEGAILDRLTAASTGRVVVSEPVQNLSNSPLAPLAVIASHLTSVTHEHESFRFSEDSLEAFIGSYTKRIITTGYIPGGREKFYVLDVTR